MKIGLSHSLAAEAAEGRSHGRKNWRRKAGTEGVLHVCAELPYGHRVTVFSNIKNRGLTFGNFHDDHDDHNDNDDDED